MLPLNSNFTHFSINFEINKLLKSVNLNSSKKNPFSLKSILITLPKLISNTNFKITFLILTDGSLLVLPYTLPKSGLSKRVSKTFFNYGVSRGDYLSTFLLKPLISIKK